MFDNCVVCKKYLKDIGEQEAGMCNYCDNVTSAISKDQLKMDYCQCTFPLIRSGEYCGFCGKRLLN